MTFSSHFRTVACAVLVTLVLSTLSRGQAEDAQIKAGDVVVATSKAPVGQGAVTSFTLQPGDEAVVREVRGTWVGIQVKGKEDSGWVHIKHLAPKKKETPPPPTPPTTPANPPQEPPPAPKETAHDKSAKKSHQPEGPREPWQSDPEAFARLFFGKDDDFAKNPDRAQPTESPELIKKLQGRPVMWPARVVQASDLAGKHKKECQAFIGKDGFILIASVSVNEQVAQLDIGSHVQVAFTLDDFIVPRNNLHGLPVIVLGADRGFPISVSSNETPANPAGDLGSASGAGKTLPGLKANEATPSGPIAGSNSGAWSKARAGKLTVFLGKQNIVHPESKELPKHSEGEYEKRFQEWKNAQLDEVRAWRESLDPKTQSYDPTLDVLSKNSWKSLLGAQMITIYLNPKTATVWPQDGAELVDANLWGRVTFIDGLQGIVQYNLLLTGKSSQNGVIKGKAAGTIGGRQEPTFQDADFEWTPTLPPLLREPPVSGAAKEEPKASTLKKLDSPSRGESRDDSNEAWQNDHTAFGRRFFADDLKSERKDGEVRQFLGSIAAKKVRWVGIVSPNPIATLEKETVIGLPFGKDPTGVILILNGSFLPSSAPASGKTLREHIASMAHGAGVEVAFTFPKQDLAAQVQHVVAAGGNLLIVLTNLENVELRPVAKSKSEERPSKLTEKQQPLSIGKSQEPKDISPAQSPSAPTKLSVAPPKSLPTMTNSIGTKFVLIPAGEFLMGSPDSDDLSHHKGDGDDVSREKPQHRVRITRPFYLGVYEVTQAEYQQVMGMNPSSYSGTGFRKSRVSGMDTSRFPVEEVTWTDAVEFCRKLSALPAEQANGRRYRLPTDAEWEYACRAGSTSRFGFDESAEQLGIYAWYQKVENLADDTIRVHPVGGKKPNAWGLYDMQGNVCEWCQDWYDNKYYGQFRSEPAVDPRGPEKGQRRVTRGGSSNFPTLDTFCRPAYREPWTPSWKDWSLGFRLALDPSDDRTPCAVPDRVEKSAAPATKSPVAP